MTDTSYLDEIVKSQKRGDARGIHSICSAHPWVLQTALHGEQPVLVESTCNQVNQFGGYTGMNPEDFVRFVNGVAQENGFPTNLLILGGDHLGPSPWQDSPTMRAMQRAADMVRAYVRAGYRKIHLDASMKLGDDDPTQPLAPELAARRTAWLAKAAEETLQEIGDDPQSIRYVVGSEVPIPGGAISGHTGACVTSVVDVRRTLELTQAAFEKEGLQDAWERVFAVVVQPGVEFGDSFVDDYDPSAGEALARFSEGTRFIFEAHSTDYQTEKSLRSLVRDHFAFLKVGPALTFAFRQAVFALARIEEELLPRHLCSNLIASMDLAMQRNPEHWEKHYTGSEKDVILACRYSLSDRIRYYWGTHPAQNSLEKLISNLQNTKIPLTLISEFLPVVYREVREGRISAFPQDVIRFSIKQVLDGYIRACTPSLS